MRRFDNWVVRFVSSSLAVIGFVGGVSLSALAGTFELRNDSLQDGGTGAIQAGFAEGEIGGAVYSPDASLFPLQVTHVQIFWRSLFGGGPDTLGRAIKFYQGGTGNPPNPTEVFSLDGPVMADGFLNDFDVTPLNISFNHGPFAIGFQFDQAPDHSFGPSLVTDTDGCQAGKDLIFAIPGGWTNGCSLGIRGDFVIRCIVETSSIGPEVTCRYGTVDTGSGGPPKDVLTVNGSIGDPVTREMSVSTGVNTIGIVKPPSGGTGLYAFWIFDGAPSIATIAPANAFNGAGGAETLGDACFCLPSNNAVAPGSCPCPMTFPVGFTAKTISGAAAARNVCLHQSPRDPFPPTTFSVDFPVGTFTIEGIIFDRNSSSPGPRKIGITNAVVLHVN